MSHVTGTVQGVTPSVSIGPDSGTPPTSPNTWAFDFAYAPAPAPGTKLVILHFQNVSLPAANRIEVDLGYDTDVFTSANGGSFWTRPVNPAAAPGNIVRIRYITDGAANGGASIDRYGRGERMPGEKVPSALSNCDPFLLTSPYIEPIYDPFWFCSEPPDWDNVMCVSPGTDVRRRITPAIGMFIAVHPHSGGDVLSTCSVTLVQNDLILTAGHCFDPGEEASMSVTFDYQTNCDGTRLGGYNARFFKVLRLVRHRYIPSGSVDYALLQIDVPPTGLGITPVPMRTDLPAVGEQVFGLHHPNGSVKKISRRQSSPVETVSSSTTSSVRVDFDVSGGSSGSGLFDMQGRVIGVLSSGVACSLGYYPTKSLLDDLAITLPEVTTRDVMIVLDRSGSMSEPAGTGLTKMEEARAAASLFVQLVRAGTGNRAGLVSFSTAATAPVDFAIGPVNAANKNSLTGPAPHTTGIIGGIAPGGATSIGDGLRGARLQFPAPGANPRAILLLTDGLQNTAPTIADEAGALVGIDIHAIGFGTEANLDGAILTELAQSHNGLYMRAGTGLQLKKFFVLAFGNIFENGTLFDPEFFLPAAQKSAPPLPFTVCGEEVITAVLGWDNPNAFLMLQLRSPAGILINAATGGAEAASGTTWMFLRVPLPAGGERDGRWQAEVFRPGGGEFPSPAVDVNYFVNVVASGGAVLERIPDRTRFYTGETINPLVSLRYRLGGIPRHAHVHCTVTTPLQGPGKILARAGLGRAVVVNGDTIPSRQATLRTVEQQTGMPVVQYTQTEFALLDDRDSGTFRFEPAGVYGNPRTDLLRIEGQYTFHVRASYGEGCVTTRETQWTVSVDVGIDPSPTEVVTNVEDDGRVRVTFTPSDRFGNLVGPGRAGDLAISGATGTTVTGPAADNGDGSYTVEGAWDSGSGKPPGVVVEQPGRPPVAVVDETFPTQEGRGSLVIRFTDTDGNPVSDVADVFLAHQTLSDRREARRWPTERRLVLRDLVATHTGIYSVQALPDHHEAVGRFASIREGRVTYITLVLKPTEPKKHH